MFKFLRRLLSRSAARPEGSIEETVRWVVAEAKGLPIGAVNDETVIDYPEAKSIAVSLAFALQRQVSVSVGMTAGELIAQLKEGI